MPDALKVQKGGRYETEGDRTSDRALRAAAKDDGCRVIERVLMLRDGHLAAIPNCQYVEAWDKVQRYMAGGPRSLIAAVTIRVRRGSRWFEDSAGIASHFSKLNMVAKASCKNVPP
ncbi:hypothetical protein [Burkholderia ambifaria]|uniref:hypothetical protein n=1 Tax=Burkholderia ambifaria TaxID=152480 RepID=UPI0012FD7601|nr:hypothetical protein [Burkholderia ambifaria]